MRSARIAPVLIVPAVFALLITLIAAPAPAPAVEPAPAANASALTAERTTYIERATRSVFRTPAPKPAPKKVAPKPKPKPKPKPVVHKTVHKAVKKSVPGTKGDAQRYARALVPADQWGCLKTLWTKESGWRTTAISPSGKHHGIPQLLSESLRGAGYKYQVDRGLKYIDHRYGSPCRAWAHFQAHRWY